MGCWYSKTHSITLANSEITPEMDSFASSNIEQHAGVLAKKQRIIYTGEAAS